MDGAPRSAGVTCLEKIYLAHHLAGGFATDLAALTAPEYLGAFRLQRNEAQLALDLFGLPLCHGFVEVGTTQIDPLAIGLHDPRSGRDIEICIRSSLRHFVLGPLDGGDCGLCRRYSCRILLGEM